MEKYITWYQMLLKLWIRKKSNLLQIAGIFAVIWLIANIHFPAVDNVRVGLCNKDGRFAGSIIDELLSSESVFRFECYDDETELKNAVISGEMECGFVFEEGMEKKLNRDTGKRKDLISYIATPLTTKGKVAKETVYAAFLEQYSEKILIREEENVFGKTDPSISTFLLEKNAEFLDGDQIFRMDYAFLETENAAETQGTQTFPIHGMAALFIFLAVFLEHGKKFSSKEIAFENALPQKEALNFEYSRYLASATVPALTGLICIGLSGRGHGIIRECLSMLILVLLSTLWMLIVGRLFRNVLSYTAWTMTLILVQLLLCPVFVDMAQYVPALSYIRCLFPAGIYLQYLLV